MNAIASAACPPLAAQTVLVTGGARGLGRAIPARRWPCRRMCVTRRLCRPCLSKRARTLARLFAP